MTYNPRRPFQYPPPITGQQSIADQIEALQDRVAALQAALAACKPRFPVGGFVATCKVCGGKWGTRGPDPHYVCSYCRAFNAEQLIEREV